MKRFKRCGNRKKVKFKPDTLKKIILNLAKKVCWLSADGFYSDFAVQYSVIYNYLYSVSVRLIGLY